MFTTFSVPRVPQVCHIVDFLYIHIPLESSSTILLPPNSNALSANLPVLLFNVRQDSACSPSEVEIVITVNRTSIVYRGKTALKTVKQIPIS
jgi:hypothetical protein